MDTPKNILNIAHRGANSVFIENTMAAFRAAVAMNADMIEIDVRLSKDGVPFVLHDASLNTHSTQKGLITEYASDEIKKIELFPSSGESPEERGIPMLEDVLDFARGKIPLNIEIKKEAVTDELENGVEHKCLRFIEKYGMLDQVLFSSFDLRVVQHVKQLNPDVAAAVLYSSQPNKWKLPSQIVQHYNADAFHCTYRQLSRRWIKDLKDHHIPVIVYTVNRASKMRKLIDLGVNGIITDKPDLLNDVLSQP